MKGKVEWYDRKKGYGFIDAEDGRRYFVHYTVVSEELKVNDCVTFTPIETDKGIQCSNVKKLNRLENNEDRTMILKDEETGEFKPTTTPRPDISTYVDLTKSNEWEAVTDKCMSASEVTEYYQEQLIPELKSMKDKIEWMLAVLE